VVTTYVIELVAFPGEWQVVVGRPHAPAVVHSGTALACIAWCEAQGAHRRGPRLYRTETA
jgi:hypothetical protein